MLTKSGLCIFIDTNRFARAVGSAISTTGIAYGRILSSVQIGPLEPVGPLKMDRTGPASTPICDENWVKSGVK